MKQKLLTRNEFKEAVFKRDGYCCVVCKKPAKDAHHVIERRLWDDGGYYLDNGVSLCEEHHLKAEMTILTCEELRDLAGIQKVIVPEHLYTDCIIDKWGNPIMPNGRRLRGELFDDLSVQKILDEGGVLNLFSRYVKYPRTYHLPWSPGATDDDRIIKSADVFKDKEVVVTVKMDGENCLDGDTLITTKNGQITIRELCNRNDISEVLSFNHETGQQEWKNINARRILPSNEDWYEIELENGQSIRLTGEHKVWCNNLNCYRMVKDLDGSEELMMKE